MSDPKRYEMRGVSASKSEVHEAIKGLDKGLYPLAFCKILPDIAAGDPNFVNIMHADTAGTKTSLAYMYWKAIGDLSVWKGIAQDSIVMNLDDMACVGITDGILLSSTIGRNKNIISGDVIAQIINGTSEFVEMLAQHGVGVHLSGGETADVGDIVRTIDVGFTAFARVSKEKLIVNNIQDKDVIVGFASYGQATYEDAYNGGMGSNGLTSARHDVLGAQYRETFKDAYDPNTPMDYIFSGSKAMDEKISIEGQDIDIAKLILSPTRTFMPLLKAVLDKHRPEINGIIHNTGGAHTKVKKFAPGKLIIKDNLLEIPPLFKMIQEESKTDYKEMFQVFNMGTRLEIYTNESAAQSMIEISKSFGIDAQIIGRVEDAATSEVRVIHEGETYQY